MQEEGGREASPQRLRPALYARLMPTVSLMTTKETWTLQTLTLGPQLEHRVLLHSQGPFVVMAKGQEQA